MSSGDSKTRCILGRRRGAMNSGPRIRNSSSINDWCGHAPLDAPWLLQDLRETCVQAHDFLLSQPSSHWGSSVIPRMIELTELTELTKQVHVIDGCVQCEAEVLHSSVHVHRVARFAICHDRTLRVTSRDMLGVGTGTRTPSSVR